MRVTWRAAFGGCLGVTLLELCAVAKPHATCPAKPAHQNLSHVLYQPGPDVVVSSLSAFVQSFLGTVQPNQFPTDLVLKLMKTRNTDQETIEEWLRYQAGFLVCAAIGILYIVLMPLVGFCFACCRCCGNCGGRMHQEQTKSIHSRRQRLYWATVIVTLIILAGNICMFQNNQSLATSVKLGPGQFNSTLGNLQKYLSSVPEHVRMVVNESYATVDNVTKSLNDIGPLLGKEIQNGIKDPFNKALNSILQMSEVVNSTSQMLSQLNTTLMGLRHDLNETADLLAEVRNDVNASLHKSGCQKCMDLRQEVERISLDTSFSGPNLNGLESALKSIVEADLSKRVSEAEAFFNGIPERVSNETRDTVLNVRKQLDDIKVQISKVTKSVPLDVLNRMDVQLQDVKRSIDTYSPEVARAENYSWIAGLVLSCGILLVVLCNTLGLLLGPMGLKPHADPTERSGTADCGGTFLLAGVGFSFLFSWLFMLLVLVLFLLGGNFYALVCKPWRTQQLFQIIDTPGLISESPLFATLNPKTNLTIGAVYNDCLHDHSLWSTFQLEKVIDLNDLLNVSKYTAEIQNDFDKKNITLSTITLLNHQLRSELVDLSSKADMVDFRSITEQINNFSTPNLNTTANKLDNLASMQNDEIRAELQAEAARLRQIQNRTERVILPQLYNLNSTVQSLRDTASKMIGTVGDILRKVNNTQDFLNRNASQIVKREIGRFLNCQMGYFTYFADWAKKMITQQVGRCGPVAKAVEVTEVIVCSNMVQSLNAFWFSLGWCTIFLIPSIIVSVKLAKFYRRMKHTDVFESQIQMHSFPQATFMSK